MHSNEFIHLARIRSRLGRHSTTPRSRARVTSMDEVSFARARRFARTPEAETRGNARKNAMTFSPLSVLLHPISPASASPSPRVGLKDDERTNPARLFSSDGARGTGSSGSRARERVMGPRRGISPVDLETRSRHLGGKGGARVRGREARARRSPVEGRRGASAEERGAANAERATARVTETGRFGFVDAQDAFKRPNASSAPDARGGHARHTRSVHARPCGDKKESTRITVRP